MLLGFEALLGAIVVVVVVVVVADTLFSAIIALAISVFVHAIVNVPSDLYFNCYYCY
jgi:hypothetical protein